MQTIEVELMPKQWDFLESQAKEVLYSGAFRAGKTYALCVKLLHRASHPRAKELLTRKTLESLKGSTLMTLLQGEGDLPPVLPPGSYTHNQSEKIIRIHGGGMIQYFGLDDPTKRGSYSGTGAAVDEAVDFKEDDLMYLRGRISVNAEGLNRQLYYACNPGDPNHHVARRFAPTGTGHDRAKGHEIIETSTLDNPYLPADYLDSISGFTGVSYQRYVLGRWVGAEGLVYDTFNPSVHVRRTRPEELDLPFIISVDDGHTNPFSAGRWRIDSDGRMHRDREFVRSGLLYQSKIQALMTMGGLEADAIIADPSAKQLIAEMVNANLPVVKAKNDVFEGILRVLERLKVQGDGLPRLTVDPSCKNFLKEIGGYQWKQSKDGQKKDEPVKLNDHSMDEARYAVAYFDAGGSGPLVF